MTNMRLGLAALCGFVIALSALADDARYVSGTVTGPDGAPVGNASVELASFTDAAGNAQSGRVRWDGPYRAVTTDARGAFTLPVPDGANSVRFGVRSPDLAPGWSGDVAFTGARSAEHDVRLDPRVIVRGVVVDAATSDAIAGARVVVSPWHRHDPERWLFWTWFSGEAAPRFEVVSGPDGSFDVPGQPPGAYTAQASHDDFVADDSRVDWARFPPEPADRALRIALAARAGQTPDGVALPAHTLRFLGRHGGAVGARAHSLRVRDDGATVAVIGGDGVQLVSADDGRVIQTISTYDAPESLVDRVELVRSPQGERGSWVSFPNRGGVPQSDMDVGSVVHDVVVLRDRKSALLALGDGRLARLDMQTRKVVSDASLSNEPLACVAALDDDLVAVGTWQRVVLVDARRLEVRSTLHGLQALATAIRIAPRAGRLAAAGIGEIVVWDVASGERVGRVETPVGAPFALSADGRRLAWANGDSVVVQALGGFARRYEADGTATAIAFVRGAVAVLTGPRGLRLVDEETGTDRMPHHIHAADVALVAAGGPHVASAGIDGSVAVWLAADGVLVTRFDAEQPRDLVLSDDGGTLWVTTGRGRVHAHDAATGARLVDVPPSPQRAPRADVELVGNELRRVADGSVAFQLPPLHYPRTHAFTDADDLITPYGCGVIIWDTARLLPGE